MDESSGEHLEVEPVADDAFGHGPISDIDHVMKDALNRPVSRRGAIGVIAVAVPTLGRLMGVANAIESGNQVPRVPRSRSSQEPVEQAPGFEDVIIDFYEANDKTGVLTQKSKTLKVLNKPAPIANNTGALELDSRSNSPEVIPALRNPKHLPPRVVFEEAPEDVQIAGTRVRADQEIFMPSIRSDVQTTTPEVQRTPADDLKDNLEALYENDVELVFQVYENIGGLRITRTRRYEELTPKQQQYVQEAVDMAWTQNQIKDEVKKICTELEVDINKIGLGNPNRFILTFENGNNEVLTNFETITSYNSANELIRVETRIPDNDSEAKELRVESHHWGFPYAIPGTPPPYDVSEYGSAMGMWVEACSNAFDPILWKDARNLFKSISINSIGKGVNARSLAGLQLGVVYQVLVEQPAVLISENIAKQFPDLKELADSPRPSENVISDWAYIVTMFRIFGHLDFDEETGIPINRDEVDNFLVSVQQLDTNLYLKLNFIFEDARRYLTNIAPSTLVDLQNGVVSSEAWTTGAQRVGNVTQAYPLNITNSALRYVRDDEKLVSRDVDVPAEGSDAIRVFASVKVGEVEYYLDITDQCTVKPHEVADRTSHVLMPVKVWVPDAGEYQVLHEGYVAMTVTNPFTNGQTNLGHHFLTSQF